MYYITFKKQEHATRGIALLQEKVGDSVIIHDKNKYVITKKQLQKLNDNSIEYSLIKEI